MMSQSKKIFSIAIFTVWASVIALPVQAATCNSGRILPDCACSGNCTANDFIIMFVNIAQLLLSVVGLVALLFFISGGFTWIMSGGNSERVSSGRSKMTNAVIGLVIVIAAWAIMNTVYYVFAQSNSNTVFGSKWFELKALEDMNPPTTAAPTGFGAGNGPGTMSGLCTGPLLGPLHRNAVFPHKDSQALTDLRNCVEPLVNAAHAGWIGTIYTFEVGDDPATSNELCNYTRGDEHDPCTPICAHTIYSCHYGGFDGTDGAMGVDYNANLANTTEAKLFDAIKAAANTPDCINLHGLLIFEGDHTHISAAGCVQSE